MSLFVGIVGWTLILPVHRRAQSGHDAIFEGSWSVYKRVMSGHDAIFEDVAGLGTWQSASALHEAGSLVPLGAPAIRREPVLEKASVAQDCSAGLSPVLYTKRTVGSTDCPYVSKVMINYL